VEEAYIDEYTHWAATNRNREIGKHALATAPSVACIVHMYVIVFWRTNEGREGGLVERGWCSTR